MHGRAGETILLVKTASANVLRQECLLAGGRDRENDVGLKIIEVWGDGALDGEVRD